MRYCTGDGETKKTSCRTLILGDRPELCERCRHYLSPITVEGMYARKKHNFFCVYVLGSSGSGKTSSLAHLLTEIRKIEKRDKDKERWYREDAYVHHDCDGSTWTDTFFTIIPLDNDGINNKKLSELKKKGSSKYKKLFVFDDLMEQMKQDSGKVLSSFFTKGREKVGTAGLDVFILSHELSKCGRLGKTIRKNPKSMIVFQAQEDDYGEVADLFAFVCLLKRHHFFHRQIFMITRTR